MPEEKIHESIVIYDLVTQLCYSGFLNDRIAFKEVEQKIKMCLDQQTKKNEKEIERLKKLIEEEFKLNKMAELLRDNHNPAVIKNIIDGYWIQFKKDNKL